jgi:signal transduction histidine kinase
MHPTTRRSNGVARERGILAPTTSLGRWLDGVLVAVVAACALRYVTRHDLDAAGVAIIGGSALLATVYLGRHANRSAPRWPTVWITVVLVLWGTLTLAAPSFAWTSVPLAFAALQVLPFRYAVGAVTLMAVTVSVGWLRIADGPDPTAVVGPIGMALVTVTAYRVLERESQARQRLLDELTAAQADLAAEQRHSGALAERTRLSRDIHDSVGQQLSSINLLLNAADEEWETAGSTARELVRTAAGTARDGLDEVRRVVRDLAPAGLAEDSGAGLRAALADLVAEAPEPLSGDLRVHGMPVPLPPPVAAALVRTARGALANTVEHANARRVVLSLTYQPDEVRLDVRDDGVGFVPQPAARPVGTRGRGLTGIRERAESLGGRATVESSPTEGTTVSVAFPLAGVEEARDG